MHAENVQIALLKLKDGSRLLRLTEPETGLALERTLNPRRPLLAQKQRLKALFESMIQRADDLMAA
ncbi:MAG: hypothetical protein IPK32_26025 [Verrucomicrobiaceae bacterium]|nr:hypothetical protein [Verrucomicrobiaceae bacterium]